MTQVVGEAAVVQDQPSGRIGPKKVKDLYDKGRKSINAEQQRHWENLSFLQGEQWVFWSRERNRLEELPRDPSRVRVVVNRLASTLRRLIAKSTKKPLVFEVPPSGADDATIQGARIAESVIQDLKREQEWETRREETTIAALTGGTGLLCLDWDASAGTVIETDEGGRQVGTGEVVLTTLSIVEAVTEPGTRDIERAYWWIKAQALPASEVQESYNLPEKPAADASQALSPVQRKVLSADRTTQPEDLCLVLTYYERPSSKNPKGQISVVVGDKEVDGPHDWHFPFTDRLNVCDARETKVLARWTGDTILSHAVPVQTAYNQIWSSIIEHTKLAGNARVLWPAYAGDAVDSLSDLPSEVIEYMSGPRGEKPEWWFPTQLPAWLLEQPSMLAREMDDILGTPDVARGEAPRNIESGSGLAILQEQAETPIAKLAQDVANAYARFASMALECYAANVTETRQARVDYPHQVSESVSWTGEDLQGQTRAIVPENAVLPISEAEVWTKGVNLYDRGFFLNPDGSQNRLAFARFIESSGEENFVEATDADVSKAQRENYRMALGEPMLPAEFDDHGKHIEVLNIYRKSASYERLPEDRRQLFDMHAQAHEVLAAQDAAMRANRQMQGVTPDLAAAPTANDGLTVPPTTNGQTPAPETQPGSVDDQILAEQAAQ